MGALLLGAAPLPALASEQEEPSYFTLASGWFGVGRGEAGAVELHMEYRSGSGFWIVRPFGGVMGVANGAGYFYSGILFDIPLGQHFALVPSFAPGWYLQGSGFDLGFPLEFRSQVELAYRFSDQSRLGLSFSHMSNASLGRINPGAESLTLHFSTALPTGGL